MAGRYDNIKTHKDPGDGRRKLPSILYPNIPFSPKDIYVRTVAGDRLDLLAAQFYGDVSYWWIIAHANALGKGTLAIPEGTQVRIPANPVNIQQFFNELNK
jgi:hypothetical protein